VLGEGIFCALIGAVCTVLRGPAETSNLLSRDGGFLRSFKEQMRGFHDLLRQKPSLPVHIVGMELDLSMRYMYLGLVERMAVWCGAPS
jgi:hypothetical protein